MDKNYFIELLAKYLQGNATEEERRFLLSYYNLFEAEPDVIALLMDKQKEELKEQMRITIWQKISLHDAVDDEKKIGSIFSRWMKVAATVLLVTSCAAGVYLFYSPPTQEGTVVTSGPLEEHRLFHLSDGSAVMVYAGSTLTYAVSFERYAKREIHLQGEADFDITHDPQKPFIVRAGNLKTTVLGTAFHITAWPSDDCIAVRVSRGKVEVSDQLKSFGIITLDQQLVYSKAKGHVVEQTPEKNSAPRAQQDLILKDVMVSRALELLRQRFKVTIICDDDVLRTKRFTTTFSKNETLEQVLKSICEFNDAVYHYDKGKAYVVIKRR